VIFDLFDDSIKKY